MELTLRRTMIRRRNVQVALAEVVLTTALGKPEDLMDPILRFIDTLLDDEQLVDRVHQILRGRCAQTARRGRYGTAAEVVLRLQVLKHLKGWSFEQLQWEVTGNLSYRHLCRIHTGKVPDSTTMVGRHCKQSDRDRYQDGGSTQLGGRRRASRKANYRSATPPPSRRERTFPSDAFCSAM